MCANICGNNICYVIDGSISCLLAARVVCRIALSDVVLIG